MQAPAVFSAPGFDAQKHFHYDSMHLIAGVLGDTAFKCSVGNRYSSNAKAQRYEEERNGDRLQGMPQVCSQRDIDRRDEAAKHVVEAIDSRMFGNRLTRLFDNSRSNKMSVLYALGSPFGEC